MKKRLLSVLLTLCLLFSLVPVTAAAETTGTTSDGLSYTITDEGTVTITDLDESYSGALVIPDTIEGKPVTAIDNWAFYNGWNLTSVAIPDSVTYIGKSAFCYCYSLSDVTIPENVTYIGQFAFRDCRNLTSVTIPADVTDIGKAVFAYCTALESISVSADNEGYTSVDGVLFNKDMSRILCCPAGKTGFYTIPAGVEVIEAYSFIGCGGLTSISIPDSVTYIGEYAFDSCNAMTDVYYTGTQEQWDSIGIGTCNTNVANLLIHFNTAAPEPEEDGYDDVYYVVSPALRQVTITGIKADCNKTTLEIPSKIKGCPVTQIADRAFMDCTDLTSVTIPDSVTQIGDRAFQGCTGLTSVTIPDSVTQIGDCAFQGCTGLSSVTIPDSVTQIGDGAFLECTELKEINVSADNENYISVDGVLFTKDMTELICCPAGKSGRYSIPDSVTMIAADAFFGCAGLTSVTIPDSVTYIGICAFSYCNSLSDVTIPANATYIGEYAFYGCCITSVTIPAGVTDIGKAAFSCCTELKEINVSVDNENYTSVDGVLLNKDMTSLICCPAGKSGSYVISNSVTSISYSAFESCAGLTSVTIPDSVTNIDSMAFYGCSSLTTVTIPASVATISDYVFSYCTSLKSICVSEDNENYTSVDGVLFSKDMTELVAYPAGRSGAYIIPTGTISFTDAAFEGCSGLTAVSIPDSVTDIAYNLFYDCSSLTAVFISANVDTVGYRGFYGCTALKDVYYAGTEEQWNGIEIKMGNEPLTNAAIHYNAILYGVSLKFNDVIPGEWYVPYIQNAVDNNFMSGTSATTFEPNGTATRAMFVQILYAMAGKPDVTGLTCPFTDVPAGEWYYNAVLWAYNNKVTSGTSATTFGTNDPITREQIALLLYAYTGKPEVSGELTGFADTASVDSWAYNGVLWANQNGIINGSSEGGRLYLNPLKSASRAEIATMMNAFYKLNHCDTDFSDAEVGDYITFGSYEQDNDLTNGAEPIEWRVLAIEGNQALVISKYALDCQPYNTTRDTVTWETCTLRTWLNSDFYNTAFNPGEKSRILTTNVENPDSYQGYNYDADYILVTNNTGSGIDELLHHVSGGNATADNLFLLSLDEAQKYFNYKVVLDGDYLTCADLQCSCTEYAAAQGAFHTAYYTTDDGHEGCAWWLRSKNFYEDSAALIQPSGMISDVEQYVDFDDTGIRPAMWITLT